MKKSLLIILSIFTIFLLGGLVSAERCNLNVSIINQDPYPANPGEYVKVVFQIDGLENPECGTVTFQVKEEFPFSLKPGTENPIEIRSGTYNRKFSSFYIAPYEILVDKDAIDGDTPIEVSYSSNAVEKLKEFDINIENTQVDFEIYIKDYNPSTKELTFEILNIEDNDIEALSIEIPKQVNIEVKGANRKVIGDLDSNEYTTAEFEATPKDGKIELKIIYTDIINVRREITKEVMYDSSYFEQRNGQDKKQPIWAYVLGALVIVFIVWNRVRKAKKKKKLREKHQQSK
jgi:hypothetical protein